MKIKNLKDIEICSIKKPEISICYFNDHKKHLKIKEEILDFSKKLEKRYNVILLSADFDFKYK